MAKDIIADATPEQWEQVFALAEQWIADQMIQYPVSNVQRAVERMWRHTDINREPFILVAESPLAMTIWASVFAGVCDVIEEQLMRSPEWGVEPEPRSDVAILAALRDLLEVGGEMASPEVLERYRDKIDAVSIPPVTEQIVQQLSEASVARLAKADLPKEFIKMSTEDRAECIRRAIEIYIPWVLGTADGRLDFLTRIRDERWHIDYWWRAWAGWYHGAKLLGAEWDEELLSLFTEWTNCVGAWVAYEGLVVTSRNPVHMGWEGRDLHDETGPAVIYADGWARYAIHGVEVDEQTVLHPERQTVATIHAEQNAEAKRVRIERFTHARYLKESGAEVIDTRRNDIDGTMEGLNRLPDGMKIFAGKCRSTGRIYFQEVGADVSTCAEAQDWLRGDRPGNPIGAS